MTEAPGSPTFSHSSSEESELADPVAEQFGRDCLVAAVRDADRVQQLIDEGNPVTANAVLAACYVANARSLEILLSAGSGPDARLDTANGSHVDVKDGWSSADITPNIGIDKREWFALQHAATGPAQYGADDKERRHAVISALLRYKPDLYASFKQPIWHPLIYPFPGEEAIEKKPWYDRWSETESFFDVTDSEWQRPPVAECGYGLRSILHALFEDGAYVKPILEHPSLDINLEHRDPQGRTLLHSVCRNSVGADGIIDAMFREVDRPYRNAQLIAPVISDSSLFHILRKRGADVTAVDYNGKNILHHLLEARTSPADPSRPPLIRNTLQYVLKHVPALVNSHDQYGNYPLHAALQRLRHFQITSKYTDESPLEPLVQDLLDAGADPRVRDSRGNTALHYLADNGLAEQWYSDGARALCAHFCDHGVDINARNDLGRTALEILMDDPGKIHKRRWSQHFAEQRKVPSLQEVDGQVLGMFEKAGARWAEQDGNGRTLLHLVARHATDKAAFRTSYLLAKSVDPSVKDNKGRTAGDVARQSSNKAVIELLGQIER